MLMNLLMMTVLLLIPVQLRNTLTNVDHGVVEVVGMAPDKVVDEHL